MGCGIVIVLATSEKANLSFIATSFNTEIQIFQDYDITMVDLTELRRKKPEKLSRKLALAPIETKEQNENQVVTWSESVEFATPTREIKVGIIAENTSVVK